jgi:hypothetical protein
VSAGCGFYSDKAQEYSFWLCFDLFVYFFLYVDLEINGEPVEVQMQLDDEGDVSKQVTQLYYTVRTH